VPRQREEKNIGPSVWDIGRRVGWGAQREDKDEGREGGTDAENECFSIDREDETVSFSNNISLFPTPPPLREEKGLGWKEME
jgi:hypothetical protein